MRWRPVVGYEGFYEVSDHGDVRSVDRRVGNRHGTFNLRRGRPMTQVRIGQRIGGGGGRYAAVGLSKGGKQRLIKVHVMVAEAFIGPRPQGYVTRHLNGDEFNNHYKNLAWGTYQENADDMAQHGSVLRGEKHPLAKLTEAKARRIRALLPTRTNQSIADQFGLSNQTISNIRLGKSWKEQ